MDKEEIEQKIKELKQIISKIKNKQTRLQQRKYMHRLQKELNKFNSFRKDI